MALLATAFVLPGAAQAGAPVPAAPRDAPVAPSATVTAGWTAAAGTPAKPAAPNVRSFHVVGPGGAAASGATVLAWVLRRGPEPASLKPYAFHADALGDVRLEIPLSDTVIRSMPKERMFNVVATVVDGGPGVPTKPVAVPFILNLGNPLWPADPTRIEGSLVRLAAAPAALPGALPGGAGARKADECAQLVAGYVCNETTYPLSLRAVPVPVADNFGAGADFVTSVEYRNSHHTTSSTLVGTDGVFVEIQHSATLGEDSTVFSSQARNGVRGGTPDEELRIATQFKIVRTYGCAQGYCWESSVVSPDRMSGTASTVASLSLHDQMSESTGSLDCGNYLEKGSVWGNTQGHTKELSFTVGFDVNAQIKWFNMHAMSVYEKYNELRDTASYDWRVKSSPTYPYHYVYVPGGLLLFDPSKPEGGPEACPVNNPGNTWTHATNRPDLTADAPGYPVVQPPPETQPVAEPAKHTVGRCEAAPERCGQE
jgi:hypothetical protein